MAAQPAMKVCVPQWPTGATAINLVPRKLQPCNRTILVFTEVWSTRHVSMTSKII